MSAEDEFRLPAWVREWDLVGLRRFHLHDGVNMPYAEYASRYQSQLQVGMSEVKRLYLDTNFWIHFRDIERGIARSNPYRSVYDRVRAAVADRRLICIYSHTSFMEAARQDVASFRVLAGVIDELTEGVAIAPRQMLFAIDVKEYVADRLGIENPSGSNQWTKIMLMFRGSLPEGEGIPDFVLKMALDTFWNARMSDVIDMVGSSINSFGLTYDADLLAVDAASCALLLKASR